VTALRPYGCREDATTPLGPLAPDLTRATTFAYPTAEELRAVGAGELSGEFYPRYGHPAGRLFEQKVAELEGADGAVSFGSGMAALHAIFCGLLQKGDVVAVSRYVYGGAEGLVAEDLPRFGIEVRRFDPFDESSLEQAVEGSVRLIHVETPTNPLCRVVDLKRIAAAARRCGAWLSVDATFLPPPFQRPVTHDADVVMHSATKILGGRRMRDNGGRVTRVHYPGLPRHPDHHIARQYMETFGFMLAFEVAGGLPEAVEVYNRLRDIARAVSLGGVETLASIPLHTSHATMSTDERQRVGIADGLIRLSFGIEPYELLEADLAAALSA